MSDLFLVTRKLPNGMATVAGLRRDQDEAIKLAGGYTGREVVKLSEQTQAEIARYHEGAQPRRAAGSVRLPFDKAEMDEFRDR